MTYKTKLLKIFLLTIIPLSILFIIIVNEVVLNNIYNKNIVEYREELILEKKEKLLSNINLIKRNLYIKLKNRSIEKLTQNELDVYKVEVLEYIKELTEW